MIRKSDEEVQFEEDEERQKIIERIEDITDMLKDYKKVDCSTYVHRYRKLNERDMAYHRISHDAFGMHLLNQLIQFLNVYDPNFEVEFVKFMNGEYARKLIKADSKKLRKRLETNTTALLAHDKRVRQDKLDKIEAAFRNKVISDKERKRQKKAVKELRKVNLDEL